MTSDQGDGDSRLTSMPGKAVATAVIVWCVAALFLLNAVSALLVAAHTGGMDPLNALVRLMVLAIALGNAVFAIGFHPRRKWARARDRRMPSRRFGGLGHGRPRRAGSVVLARERRRRHDPRRLGILRAVVRQVILRPPGSSGSRV
jgi:hypothetical protein